MVNLFDECYLVDMSNIRFISDNTFHIEESDLYKHVGKRVRSVEFIRVDDDKLLFIEARTTFANPANSEDSFQTQINEVCDKFVHSINLYSSVRAGVNDVIFSDDFIPPKQTSIVFVIVYLAG